MTDQVGRNGLDPGAALIVGLRRALLQLHLVVGYLVSGTTDRGRFRVDCGVVSIAVR
jgi:hypothetical protein